MNLLLEWGSLTLRHKVTVSLKWRWTTTLCLPRTLSFWVTVLCVCVCVCVCVCACVRACVCVHALMGVSRTRTMLTVCVCMYVCLSLCRERICIRDIRQPDLTSIQNGFTCPQSHAHTGSYNETNNRTKQDPRHVRPP